MAFEPERLLSSSTIVSLGDLSAQVVGTALGSDQLTEKLIPCVDQLPGEEFSFTARNSSEGIGLCTSPHASPCLPSASAGLWGSHRTPL